MSAEFYRKEDGDIWVKGGHPGDSNRFDLPLKTYVPEDASEVDGLIDAKSELSKSHTTIRNHDHRLIYKHEWVAFLKAEADAKRVAEPVVEEVLEAAPELAEPVVEESVEI